MGLALPLEGAKTPIGKMDTKVVADVADVVMAELLFLLHEGLARRC